MEYTGNLFMSLLTALILGLGSLWGQPSVIKLDTNLILGTTTAQVVQVIDGDTIEVTLGSSSARIKVRYIGIDTPEPYANQLPECGSKEASARNQELVGNKTVTLVPGLDPYDTYGRMLAYVYVESIFVNETLVREGYASVLMIKPNTQFKISFNDLYTYARIHQLGIWSVCN